MKILAIEDNNDNLIILRALLNDAFPDLILYTAFNGRQGIELAIEQDPDVILLDILMPGMDGFEVCRQMKMDDRLYDIPVVFVTALKESKANRIKALEVGAEAFLYKPIDETELTAQIRAMVKIKQVNKQNRDEKEQLAKLVSERTKELERSRNEMIKLLDDLSVENVARKNTEVALLRSERQKATLISNLPGFVYRCLCDPDWTMKYISDGCKTITGYSSEAFLDNTQLTFNDIIVSDYHKPIWLKWQKALEKKKACELEYPILTKSGETRWVWERGRGVFSDQGELQYLEGFITDITEKKQAEDKLKQSETRLKDLNATKDKFFSIIAHDLRSPFNSILGFSKLLIEEIQQKDYAGVEQYAEIIRDSSQRSMDLLINLLEWSRSQTGRMDFLPEYVEIGGLVNDAIELTNDTAQQKSITIYRKGPQKVIAFADKTMLSTIMRNLISNAIKFTNQNGEISISVEPKQDELMVAIRDNGVGIQEQNIEKLFRMDEGFSTSGTQNEQGTGLGLVICKDFILKHQGKIWVESESGVGSTFYFTIPKHHEKEGVIQ